jgi:hypothetical protein
VQQKIEDEDEDEFEDDFRNMAKTLPHSPIICGICGFNFGKRQIRSERHEPKTEEKK